MKVHLDDVGSAAVREIRYTRTTHSLGTVFPDSAYGLYVSDWKFGLMGELLGVWPSLAAESNSVLLTDRVASLTSSADLHDFGSCSGLVAMLVSFGAAERRAGRDWASWGSVMSVLDVDEVELQRELDEWYWVSEPAVGFRSIWPS
jgi:hypothetical protein